MWGPIALLIGPFFLFMPRVIDTAEELPAARVGKLVS